MFGASSLALGQAYAWPEKRVNGRRPDRRVALSGARPG